MPINLTYLPDKGISFGNTLLLWGTDRQQVRVLLNDKFKPSDDIIDLNQYGDDDNTPPIIQRRDIYNNYQGQDNLFFLNFDINDRLTEAELHYGLDISIKDVMINFSMDLEKVIELLDKISNEREQLLEGEFFYRGLKLIIASGEAMGGEGNELSYFYCSKDVSHLIKE